MMKSSVTMPELCVLLRILKTIYVYWLRHIIIINRDRTLYILLLADYKPIGRLKGEMEEPIIYL
jgi:hypothetical protein